jgi:hypothetical protein
MLTEKKMDKTGAELEHSFVNLYKLASRLCCLKILLYMGLRGDTRELLEYEYIQGCCAKHSTWTISIP